MADKIKIVIKPLDPIKLELKTNSTSHIQIKPNVSFPVYTGEYEFAPSQQEQVVQTQGRVLLQNIVIDPVPSNYGLITYNGSVLTVS